MKNIKNGKKLEIYGYGEDALTLCYLKDENRYSRTVLSKGINKALDLKNKLSLEKGKCMIFYRPGFARGKKSFGEPDFVIFTKTKDEEKGYWIIGESKWSRSSEINNSGKISIRDSQGDERIKKFNNLFDLWKLNQTTDENIKKEFGVESKHLLYKTITDFLDKANSFFKDIEKDKVEIKFVLVVFRLKEDQRKYKLCNNGYVLVEINVNGDGFIKT